jgi:hypothetical protein
MFCCVGLDVGYCVEYEEFWGNCACLNCASFHGENCTCGWFVVFFFFGGVGGGWGVKMLVWICGALK